MEIPRGFLSGALFVLFALIGFLKTKGLNIRIISGNKK